MREDGVTGGLDGGGSNPQTPRRTARRAACGALLTSSDVSGTGGQGDTLGELKAALDDVEEAKERLRDAASTVFG